MSTVAGKLIKLIFTLGWLVICIGWCANGEQVVFGTLGSGLPSDEAGEDAVDDKLR